MSAMPDSLPTPASIHLLRDYRLGILTRIGVHEGPDFSGSPGNEIYDDEGPHRFHVIRMHPRDEFLPTLRYAHESVHDSYLAALQQISGRIKEGLRAYMESGHGDLETKKQTSAYREMVFDIDRINGEIAQIQERIGASEPAHVFWHATALKNIPSIARDGLKPGSYLASRHELARYYAETVADEGDTPVLLEVRMSAPELEHLLSSPECMEADHEGIAEPICTVIGKSEEDVWRAWAKGPHDAAASLELVGSARCMVTLPPEKLVAHYAENDPEPVQSLADRLLPGRREQPQG